MILFVDDEELLLTLARHVLADSGHELLTAGTVAGARDVIAQHGDEIDLAIVDLNLPDGTGWGVCSILWENAPGAKIVISSSEPQVVEPADLTIPDGALEYLRKPYGIAQLSGVVTEALNS